MSLDHLGGPQDLSPVEQMQAEVDAERDQHDARDAQLAEMRAEMQRMRRELAEARGAAAEPVAPTAEDVEAVREQELLAKGCVKVPLTIDDPEHPGQFLRTYVWVRAHNEWRQDAIAAVGTGQFPYWAQECLATAEDLAEWMDANPSLVQIKEFFFTWRGLTGQDEGKSLASPTRSRRTPLR